MTSHIKGVIATIKNFFSPSDSATSADGVYYPPRHSRPSSFFGLGAPPFFANNNHTNSTAHRNYPSSTLQSSYYNSNNHWPPVPKAPNSNSYSITAATGSGGALSSILENNNCRKRSAEFAFKNCYRNQNSNHTNSYSFTAKRDADIAQHLTDDEDEDTDFAKPSAKKFLPSFSKTGSFYPVNNCNNSNSSGARTSALNHIGFNNLNNSSSASNFSLGLGIPSFPSLSASVSGMKMNRPLTRFTTAPRYQKKVPRKEPEPECITISDEDDIDTEDAPQSFVGLPQFKSKASASGPSISTWASRAKETVPSVALSVPRLFSTSGRISSPTTYQKRTTLAESNSNNVHSLTGRSSYFPSLKMNMRQRSSSPRAAAVAANHKNTNTNSRMQLRHSIGAASAKQPKTVLIGDTDDEDESESEFEDDSVSASASEVKSMEAVQKVDRGCGPDDKDDPLKKREELLFGKKPTITATPASKLSPSWGDRLSLSLRTKLRPRLDRGLFNNSPSGGATPNGLNGGIFAFGALIRSRSSSLSNDNGDSSTKAFGHRGSSSNSFSSDSRRGSEVSTPKSKSPISMSTEHDAKFYGDIQILSETILSPPQPYAVNSLELETSQVEVRDKGWLQKKVQEYSDRFEHNNAEIEFEKRKIEVLKNESTLIEDINEKVRRQLKVTGIITLEPVPAALPEITEEMQRVVDHAFRLRNDSEVLATAFNIQITRADLKTLKPCQWLNDNVINTYMDMIAERSRKTSGLPSVHVFTTFFYPKFQKEGYSNILKRWTRKVDIFSFDLLIFPIHLGVHWCLAAADLRKNRIQFFDSLLGNHMTVVKSLLKYLASEMQERKKQTLNANEWSLEVPKDIPTQDNGSDCGVFSCKFAEYVSRDAPLTFKQENMNYYRSRMVYEIIKQELMHP